MGGSVVGLEVGSLVGLLVGFLVVGLAVGGLVGMAVVGSFVGESVGGAVVGSFTGEWVGELVTGDWVTMTTSLGALVGTGVNNGKLVPPLSSSPSDVGGGVGEGASAKVKSVNPSKSQLPSPIMRFPVCS